MGKRFGRIKLCSCVLIATRSYEDYSTKNNLVCKKTNVCSTNAGACLRYKKEEFYNSCCTIGEIFHQVCAKANWKIWHHDLSQIFPHLLYISQHTCLMHSRVNNLPIKTKAEMIVVSDLFNWTHLSLYTVNALIRGSYMNTLNKVPRLIHLNTLIERKGGYHNKKNDWC